LPSSLRPLKRCGALLLLATSLAGCAWLHHETPTAAGAAGPDGANSSNDGKTSAKKVDCKRNRSSCLYKGSYESGERAYAANAARRLNQAELERLRHAFGH